MGVTNRAIEESPSRRRSPSEQGVIDLRAPLLLGSGLLLAQGGGGGGATDVSMQTLGGDGGDGLATISAAPGGSATGTGIMGEVNRGGSGGYRDAAPESLTAISGAMSGNGGGGGGGVGRIVVRDAAVGGLGASPAAVVVP